MNEERRKVELAAAFPTQRIGEQKTFGYNRLLVAIITRTVNELIFTYLLGTIDRCLASMRLSLVQARKVTFAFD